MSLGGYYRPSEEVMFYGKHYGLEAYLTFTTWKEFHVACNFFEGLPKPTLVKIAVRIRHKINKWEPKDIDHALLMDYYVVQSQIKGVQVRITNAEEINQLNEGFRFKALRSDFRKVCGVTGDHEQGNIGKSKRKRRRKKRKKVKVSNNTLTKDHVSRGVEENWSTLEALERVKKENGTNSIVV